MFDGQPGDSPEDLDEFASDLQRAHNQLLVIDQELSEHIGANLSWKGANAFVFKHAWQSSYAPVLRNVATMLEATSTYLLLHADEQEPAGSEKLRQ